jgi:hypothetical protein
MLGRASEKFAMLELRKTPPTRSLVRPADVKFRAELGLGGRPGGLPCEGFSLWLFPLAGLLQLPDLAFDQVAF